MNETRPKQAQARELREAIELAQKEAKHFAQNCELARKEASQEIPSWVLHRCLCMVDMLAALESAARLCEVYER